MDFEQDSCRSSKENNDYFPLVILAKSGANGISGINGFGPFRGIDITVVTDKNCNIAHVDDDKRQEKQHLLNDAVEKLNKMGIATKLVNRVHSKIVIEDEELLCVGSFNWFSAAREDKYQRYDTSLVYRGEGVKNEIKAIYGSLDQRQL